MKALSRVQEIAPQSELTPRQHQILELLQEGKVNKEIANELGIGIGTVKQHVVALFKKLNVTNRTMAVTTGIGRLRNANENSASMVGDGLLEKRPCVVLSTALPEEAESSIVRRLHGTLAALAFDHDALFLARKGNAGDVIFGIQRVTEYDVFKALSTAQAAYKDLSSLDEVLAGKLSGGLTAGLAVASMKRFGGWSGEAIASSAIFFARELVQEAGSGRIALGQPAKELMMSFGIRCNGKIPDVIFFHELDSLRWTGERMQFPLVGRSTELDRLQVAARESSSGSVRKVYLEGETGMGKSRLCREIINSTLRDGGKPFLFRCQPLGSGEVLNNILEDGKVCLPENVESILRSKPSLTPEVVIVDDFHLLAKDKQLLLLDAAKKSRPGRLIIYSGRKCEGADQAGMERIHLGRLPEASIEKLARFAAHEHSAKLRTGRLKGISKLSAGVPLFAVELAGQSGSDLIELPLLIIICGRLEGLSLDRKLLRAVAHFKGSPTIENIASGLGEDRQAIIPALERARASGVLFMDKDDGDRISFSHPILRQSINQISME